MLVLLLVVDTTGQFVVGGGKLIPIFVEETGSYMQ